MSAARLAALGPTRSTPAACVASSGTRKSCIILRPEAACRTRATRRASEHITSLHVVAVARQRVDDGNLLHREIGNDLDSVLVHDQHLLDAHAVAELLAVLRLEGKRHPL